MINHPYAAFSLNPIEFINRGQIRAEKESLAIEKQREAEHARKQLKAKLQETIDKFFLKELQATKPNNNFNSLASKFHHWLHGTERSQRLLQIEDEALGMNFEARSDSFFKAINYWHNEYKKAASDFFDVASDAVKHDMFSKCGWTWWR
jgi:hypothetical protein